MNTYRWKTYLPSDARPFIFQAWSETLTGIELKMDYLDNNNVPIDNALIMLDIPGAFDKVQLSKDALSVKHFLFTDKSRFAYNAVQFFNFIQKPSVWLSSVRKSLKHINEPCCSDTISNDWDKGNKFSFDKVPNQDSLRDCSEISRQTFFAKISHRGNDEIEVSEPLITEASECQLCHLKSIFESNGTDYYLILTPAYCYTNPAVNPRDLAKLKTIFGENRVFDFTGKNSMTEDYNNFTDPNHFGQRVGWMILEEVYVKSQK